MKTKIFGIMSVALVVVATVVVGGCGGGVSDGPVLLLEPLATSQLTLRPDGTGDYTSVASQPPNYGSHWEKLDEVSANDFYDYVYTTASSQQKDAYALTDHTTETGNINSVTVHFRIYRYGGNVAGSPTTYCQPFLRLGTSEIAGTEQPHTDDSAFSTYNQTLARPGGGTWSWTDIDNLQVCIGLRQEDGATASCTQVYVVVEYGTSEAPVADPQSLSGDSCSTLTVTLTGSDPDSDPLTYIICTLPGHGELYDGPNTSGHHIVSGELPYTITDSGNRTTYDAVDSYSGGDSFDFKVNDGALDSAEATISITVSDGRMTWYRDADIDGYGNATDTVQACPPPAGYVSYSGDCDDDNDRVYPGAEEICDGNDNDCDGGVDEEGAVGCTVYYADWDYDGYGVYGDDRCLCAPDYPYVALEDGDCDDDNDRVYPGAEEICDGNDNDCDGSVDEEGAALCDDQEPCTVDTCDNGACVHTQMACDADGWYKDGASYTECVGEGICTYQDWVWLDFECVEGECVSTEIDWGTEEISCMACEDGDLCTTHTCENGVCIQTPINCDDGDPFTIDACVGGECVYTAAAASIEGQIREVSCEPLSGATVTAYLSGVPKDGTISDGSGNYELQVSEAGTYTVVAGKTGFRTETQTTSVTEAAAYTLNFWSDHGLIPNAPDLAYAQACVYLWRYGKSPCALTEARALAVVNAWQYPV